MRELAHILLHEPNSLKPGERAPIATFVSCRNDCYFCKTSHGAEAAAHLQYPKLVQAVKANPQRAAISPRLKALLVIAGQVHQGDKQATREAVEAARGLAATTCKSTIQC